MRSATIIFTIVCALVATVTCAIDPATPAPWVKACPALATSKPICAIREDRGNVFGRVKYYLTFLSQCFLDKYNEDNKWMQYTAVGPAGKTCDDLGKIEPYTLQKPFDN